MSEDSEKEKGNVAFRSGDYATALQHYEKAIEDAGSVRALLCFLIKQKLEKYDLCIKQCLKGLAAPGLTPELKSKLYFRMALAYEAQGKFEDALEAIMKCDRSPTVLEKRTELGAKVATPEHMSTLRKNLAQRARSVGMDPAEIEAVLDRVAEANNVINLSSSNGSLPNRCELIAQHNRLLKILSDPNVIKYTTSPVRFDTLNSATSGHVSAELYCFLKPITIGQLRLHEVNVGKVLICRTITEPFMMLGALWTLIEDPTGEVMRLAIYNLGSSTDGPVDFNHALRVDNPANLLYPEQTHSLLQNVKWRTTAVDFSSSSSQYHPTQTQTWESFEKRGNEMFVARNYELAVAAYSDAIELKRKVAPKEEVADLLANRAAAYLGDDKPTDAFWDCQSALHVQPGHLKATFRLAKAHSSLGKFDQAKDVLEKSPHTSRPEFQTEILRQNRLIREQQKGDYDLKCLLKEAAASKTPRLDHANYNGGVAKLWISKEKGNGLFAQRNFAPGDLLFVSKAFEATYRSECIDPVFREVEQSIRPKNETLRNECFSRIFRRISKNKELAKELYQLFAGPDFERFDEDANAADAPAVDSGRVAAIVDLNAFGCDPFEQLDSSGHVQLKVDAPGAGFSFDGCGVWMLASFMNHSCVPNTVIFYVGDLMIVRAAKRIGKGEELTTLYAHFALDYTKRQEACVKYGFKCKCELCVCDLQRIGNHPELNGQRQSFMDSFHVKFDQAMCETDRGRNKALAKLTEDLRSVAEEFCSRLAYKNRYDPHLERLYHAIGSGYKDQGDLHQAAQFYKLSHFAAFGKGIKSKEAFVTSAPPVLLFLQLLQVTNNTLEFGKAKEYLDKLRQAAKVCWGSEDKELLLMLFPVLASSNWFEWLK